MTRPVGNGEVDDPADEDFDRMAGEALKEQADVLLFGGLEFDERMRAAIRARAAEDRVRTRRGPGRWIYLAALPAAAAALALAFRLGLPMAAPQGAGEFARGAGANGDTAAAPSELPAAKAASQADAGVNPEAMRVMPDAGSAGGASEAKAEAPVREAFSEENRPAFQTPEETLTQAERSLGFHVYRPAELPPGAAPDGVVYDPLWVRQVYRLPGGATIEITQFEGGFPDRKDPAHPANRGAERVAVNGGEGWLTRSRPASGDAGGSVTLTWQYDLFRFSVTWTQWDVPAEDLLRVAASLR